MKKTSLWKELLISQLQPLRILFYVFLVGMVIHELRMPRQSTILIFDLIWFVVFANIIFIVIIKHEEFTKIGKINVINSLLIITLGMISVEIISVFSHTLVETYDKEIPEKAAFWNWVATIFTGLGGIVLEINSFYAKKTDRWILSKVNPRVVKIILIIFGISLVIYGFWVNPLIKQLFQI